MAPEMYEAPQIFSTVGVAVSCAPEKAKIRLNLRKHLLSRSPSNPIIAAKSFSSPKKQLRGIFAIMERDEAITTADEYRAIMTRARISRNANTAKHYHHHGMDKFWCVIKNVDSCDIF